jgi:hypothetical protein
VLYRLLRFGVSYLCYNFTSIETDHCPSENHMESKRRKTCYYQDTYKLILFIFYFNYNRKAK